MAGPLPWLGLGRSQLRAMPGTPRGAILVAVPAIVWRGQDFHFPSERETCLPPCRLSRHGSWGSAGGGTAREPRSGDPWGAGSVPAWVLIVVSLGLLSAGLLGDGHVFRLALNPTILGGLSLGPGEKKRCVGLVCLGASGH